MSLCVCVCVFTRLRVCQGQAGEPLDVPDPEGHRARGLLPLLLPLVDPGDVQVHLPAAAAALPAARWDRGATVRAIVNLSR